MVDSDGHTFIRHLIANVKCAVCQHQYEPGDIQIFERHAELWVLGVTCSECQTQGLIFAIIREVSADVVQSLESDEEEHSGLDTLPTIDKDEILDLHCLLRNFDGDMYDLLVAAD
jgi:hypothetical protein